MGFCGGFFLVAFGPRSLKTHRVLTQGHMTCSILPRVGGFSIHFTVYFLHTLPYAPLIILTLTLIAATFKIQMLKEMDLSPDDAEASPTQVCRGLCIYFFFFPCML